MVTKLFLYKILSKDDWNASSKLGYLKPLLNDNQFIHLAMEDQFARIVAKFWADYDEVLIAKVDPDKVIGELIYETNPGGSNKYYHLYNGKIPLEAVVAVYPYSSTTQR